MDISDVWAVVGLTVTAIVAVYLFLGTVDEGAREARDAHAWAQDR